MEIPIRKCEKCMEEFPENELQISHDIPKYLGGKDSDGRHLLCEECHKKYDLQIFISVSSYIKNISLPKKERLRLIAIKIKEEFFKDGTTD